MNKKFELIENDSIEINGHKLYRLRALIDFNDVKADDLGGYVESENNLSQMNDCWIYDNARVFGNACVYDSARVYDDACVFGNACIFDDACVYDNANVFGNARIRSIVSIFEHAYVYANVTISGKVNICNNTHIF